MPRTTDKEGIAHVYDVTIDFYTRRVFEPGEVGVFGIEAISDSSIVVWVRVGDLYYRVTVDDLPWNTPLHPNPADSLPVTEFGACINE